MKALTQDQRSNLVALGAGGFVGSRLIQLTTSSPHLRSVPVLRSFRGLARLGVAVGDACIIDTRDLHALSKALKGAMTVVNLTMGDSARILADTQLVYRACLAAAVPQLIHVSSAVVFGRVMNPGVHDDSPPDTRSWMLYARGKAQAEVWLREQMAGSKVQVVVLRPGLIWGPGSNWSEMVGDQLLHGKAVLSNGGEGIANLIFVDNLVRIILAIACRRDGPSGFYNVADNETVTWRQYYSGLAARLGYPSDAVCLWPDSRLRVKPKHAIEWALEQPALLASAKWLLKRLGPRPKAVLKAKLKGAPGPPSGSAVPSGPPVLSRAHWVLQNTGYRLPTAKLHQDFGPLDLIPFDRALDITSVWLKFVGFSAPTRVPGPSYAIPEL